MMLRSITLIAVFGCLLTFFSASARAQNCDAASVSQDFIGFLAQFDPETTTAQKLRAMSQWLATRQTLCAINTADPVLSFSSQEHGKQPLLGPVSIPGAFYRVRVVTDGSFNAKLEITEGECITSAVTDMFRFSEGVGSRGAEILFHSLNCHAFIIINNVSDDWTLEFYRVSSRDAVPVSDVYTSDDFGVKPLLGPIQFGDGYYKVTLTTDSFFMLDVFTATGKCGNTSLFNLSSGDATEGATALISSEKCVGYLAISNTSARSPWKLTIEPIE